MPTKLKSRGNCWLARVVIDGQQVDSKVFPPGRSKGPEWMAAKTWEVERKKEFLELRERQRKTLTGFGLLLAWGEAYLDHVGRTMSRITLTEKQTVMQALFGYCREAGLTGVEDLTRSTWTLFLTKVASERGPRRANVYRKNLLAAGTGLWTAAFRASRRRIAPWSGSGRFLWKPGCVMSPRRRT